MTSSLLIIVVDLLVSGVLLTAVKEECQSTEKCNSKEDSNGGSSFGTS